MESKAARSTTRPAQAERVEIPSGRRLPMFSRSSSSCSPAIRGRRPLATNRRRGVPREVQRCPVAASGNRWSRVCESREFASASALSRIPRIPGFIDPLR